MERRARVLLLVGGTLWILLGSATPSAARPPAGVECRELTYPSQGGMVPAVLCGPSDVATPRPGIVYLHGSGGPNEAPPLPYGGIGVRLAGNPLRVEAVFPNGPAEAAGLEPGDMLRAVDGEAVAGLTVPEVLPLLRGEAGTTVVLTIARPGQPDSKDVPLVREVIDPGPAPAIPMPFALVPDLAAQGFVTLGIRYFALTPSPGPDPESFSGAPPEAYAAALPTWLQVVHDGVTALGAQPEVDPTRLGLVGWSRGGQVGLQAAAQDPRYGVIVAISSQVTEPILAGVSALPPILILHGTADQTNPVGNAFALRDALEAAGHPYDWMLYPNGDHFWRDQQGQEGFDRLVDFLRQTLITD
jgi:dienelactone hydrolase